MFDIKAFRTAKGLTQRELANTLGVDHTAISKAENRGLISDSLIEKLLANFPTLNNEPPFSYRGTVLDKVDKNALNLTPIINLSSMQPTGEVLYLPHIDATCICVRMYKGMVEHNNVAGDLLICKPISKASIPFGELMLVVTSEYRLFRMVRRSAFDGYIRLESKHGDAIEVKMEDVIQIYLSVAFVGYMAL